jgi:fumarate reductase subunit D
MTSGLILLLIVAAAIAFGYTKLRGKMKLPVAGKHWTGAIIIVVLVVLMLWATHNQGGK